MKARRIAFPAAVLGASLAVRLPYFFSLRDFPLFAWPTGDTGDYFRDALAVAGGRLLALPHVFFHSSPIYSYFLAPLAALSPGVAGGDLALAALVQLLVSAGTALVVYLLGRRLGDVGGLAAGLIYALSPIAVFYDGELLGDFLLPPLLTAAALLLAAERVTWRRAAAAGACLGVAALARANVLLLLLPAAAVCWLGAAGVPRRRRAAAVGALVGAAVLAVLPCALRNYVVGRDVVPVSANGGVNLYIGNNPHANGTFTAPAGWVTNLERKSQAYAAAKAGRPLKPSAASAYFTREALRFVVARPASYLRLVGRRARLVVNAYDIPNHGDFRFFRARSAVLRFLPFTWGVVLPWALVGAFATWRERAWRPALWFIALYGFSIVGMFFVTGRYRFPVFPLLAVLAVAGVGAVIGWIRRGPRWRLAPAAALLAGGYVAAYLPPPADVVVPASYSWHHLGEAYAGAGDDRSAARAYEKTVALAPNDAYSWNNLGLAYMRQGKLAAAEEALARARALSPANVETLNNYGALLLARGRTDEAAAYIARAVAAEPANAAARVNWGVVQLVRGDLDGAERTFRFALTLDPDFAKAYFNLGLVYEARGDGPRAAAAFREGLRLEPRNAAAREHLAAIEGRL